MNKNTQDEQLKNRTTISKNLRAVLNPVNIKTFKMYQIIVQIL